MVLTRKCDKLEFFIHDFCNMNDMKASKIFKSDFAKILLY